MAIKLKLEMTVLEGNKQHLIRVPIRFIQRGETRHDVDSQSPPNGASIDELHRSLYNDGNKVKVKIEWIPPEGKGVLFNNLKGKKGISNLEISIGWFIRDTDNSTNLVTKRGTFSGVNVTNAIGSTIQVVEFTSANFLPDLGLVHEAKIHARA